MSPEIYFALTLAVKMIVTAGFIIGATITAERAGPVIGGLVASLPISTGPVYVFLALDHDARFISAAALGTLVMNTANVAFALIYALLAQKRSLSISFGLGIGAWFVIGWIGNSINWTLASAAMLNIAAIGGSYFIVRPLRNVRVPPMHTRWQDLALRAVLAAILVGAVVTASFHIGAKASGIFGVFPTVFTSMMLIMHNRLGGKATAAVLANAILGLGGFGLAAATVHAAAAPFGKWTALLLGVSASFTWGLLIFATRKRPVPV
ncbi:MAG TPA: hypothetical protein VHD34_03455 [Xanthobacteraceae bacterium]|nr:hypothetical protein [Xanthobacteraceae bacterium]